MALYKNREVNIVNNAPIHRTANQDMVQIEHKESGMEGSLEVVPRSALTFTKDELKQQLDAKRDAIKTEEDEYNRREKERQDEEKRHLAYHREVNEAQKKNLPANAYLENAEYKIGDQVTLDGITYKSRVNGNTGNKPAEKSDHWQVVKTDMTNVVPQNKTPQVPLGKPVIIGDKSQSDKPLAN